MSADQTGGRVKPHTPGTVLVTGGCGFIGNSFIRHFLANDTKAKVINVNALTQCWQRGRISLRQSAEATVAAGHSQCVLRNWRVGA